MSMQMHPTNLQFSHSDIKSTLTEGESIPFLIREIKAGRRRIDQRWLPLEVARDKYDHKWYSQNNRRLYIFRVLELHGYLAGGTIPVSKIFKQFEILLYSSIVTFESTKQYKKDNNLIILKSHKILSH